jgi:hypothetical protein
LDVPKVGIESIISQRFSSQKDTKDSNSFEFSEAKALPQHLLKRGLSHARDDGEVVATALVAGPVSLENRMEGGFVQGSQPPIDVEAPTVLIGHQNLSAEPNHSVPVLRQGNMDDFTRLCFQNPLNCSINATGLHNISILNPKGNGGRAKIVPKFINISSTQEVTQRDSPNGTVAPSEVKLDFPRAAPNRLKNLSLIDIALDKKECPFVSENDLLFDVQANLKERIEGLFYCPRAEDMMVRDYLKDAVKELKTHTGLKPLTLDVFCDQYQFVARRSFGRAEFAAHLRKLLEEAGIKVPPRMSDEPRLND